MWFEIFYDSAIVGGVASAICKLVKIGRGGVEGVVNGYVHS
jgi:hypothetical protein